MVTMKIMVATKKLNMKLKVVMALKVMMIDMRIHLRMA